MFSLLFLHRWHCALITRSISRPKAVSALAVVSLIVALGLMRGASLMEMFMFGIALAIAVVPEALPAGRERYDERSVTPATGSREPPREPNFREPGSARRPRGPGSTRSPSFGSAAK